jgi:hypothetical protein
MLSSAILYLYVGFISLFQIVVGVAHVKLDHFDQCLGAVSEVAPTNYSM